MSNKVLDIGAGDSPYSKSADTLDRFQKYNPDIQRNLEKLPLPIEDSSYDLIVLDNVLEHLPNEAKYLDSLFQEFERILTDEGEVLIKVPYYLSPGAAGPATHTSNGYSYQFSVNHIDTGLKVKSKKLFVPKRKKLLYLGYILEPVANSFPLFYEHFLNNVLPARELEDTLELEEN